MFKGCHFPSEVILETVRYYLAYKLSYREIEEFQRERGVNVDHGTIKVLSQIWMKMWQSHFSDAISLRVHRIAQRQCHPLFLSALVSTSSTILDHEDSLPLPRMTSNLALLLYPAMTLLHDIVQIFDIQYLNQ